MIYLERFWNNFCCWLISDFVNTVLSQHMPLMEQLHTQLYRQDVDELIRKDNQTHSYR